MTIRASHELIWEFKEIAALMIIGHRCKVHPTSLSGYTLKIVQSVIVATGTW